MNPGLDISITAGTIAKMTTEQFVALRDNICAEGRWDTEKDPVRVSGGDYLGVYIGGMFIGIEKDGYTHS